MCFFSRFINTFVLHMHKVHTPSSPGFEVTNLWPKVIAQLHWDELEFLYATVYFFIAPNHRGLNFSPL